MYKRQISRLTGTLIIILAVCFIFQANSGPLNPPKKDSKVIIIKNDSIIRKGIIDVKAIDKNKDGFVYQDPMDWNVISDEPGKCPLCKMKLEKVTIETAIKNLKKHNFKVK